MTTRLRVYCQAWTARTARFICESLWVLDFSSSGIFESRNVNSARFKEPMTCRLPFPCRTPPTAADAVAAL
jgi:hypothetical protein